MLWFDFLLALSVGACRGPALRPVAVPASDAERVRVSLKEVCPDGLSLKGLESSSGRLTLVVAVGLHDDRAPEDPRPAIDPSVHTPDDLARLVHARVLDVLPALESARLPDQVDAVILEIWTGVAGDQEFGFAGASLTKRISDGTPLRLYVVRVGLLQGHVDAGDHPLTVLLDATHRVHVDSSNAVLSKRP